MEDNKQEIIKPYQKTRATLSYQMINDLLNNKKTPLYIRFKLYFGILQKYGKELYMLNDYLAKKFEVSNYQVKYHLKKLKDDGSIKIENGGSFRRKIILLEYVFVSEKELTEEVRQQQEDMRQLAFGKSRIKDNVYLSQKELYELQDLMKSEYVRYINDLDNYIKKTGVKYKSHYETLKAWWFKNQKAKNQKKKQEESPNFLMDDYEWWKDNTEEEDNDNFYLGKAIEDILEEYDQIGK